MDAFSLLAGGAKFDRQRFQKDLNAFHPQAILKPAAAPPTADPAKKKKKAKHKKKKGTGKHQAASQPEDADVAVYGGSARARTAAAELNAADSEDEDATAAPAAKRRRTAAGTAHGVVVEMSGDPPKGEGPAEPQVGPFGLPLIDEGLPQVNTNDPFEEAAVIRKATKIKVVGTHVPPPLRSFAEVHSKYKASAKLLGRLVGEGFTVPTPIQRQAIPCLLGARELLAIAPTGSGKTLAFLIPILMAVRTLHHQQHAKEHQKANEGDEQHGNPGAKGQDFGAKNADVAADARVTRGAAASTSSRHPAQSISSQRSKKGSKSSTAAPAAAAAAEAAAAAVVAAKVVQAGVKALVVSPTRELAAQQARVLDTLLPGSGLRGCLLSAATEANTDFDKVDILLANPLRVVHLIEKGRLDLSQARYLVVDEADKLFELGFMEQLDSILAAATHPDITRALFSATLPERVEDLARTVLQDPVRVTVGVKNSAVANVRQRLLFVGRETGKIMALRQMLKQGLAPPVLVFVSSKERAQELHKELMYEGVHVDSIHAGQPQAARNAAVENFRSGRTWVLVATDLIGRGMDFVGVNTVINYDFPHSTADYVHRIGRTGRAGRSGDAITFFTEGDKGSLRPIAAQIAAAGGDVPEWMLALKKQRKNRDKSTRVSLLEEEEERAQQLQGTQQAGHINANGAAGKGAVPGKLPHAASGKWRGKFKKHKAGTGICTVPLFDVQRAAKKRTMQGSKKRKVQAAE